MADYKPLIEAARKSLESVHPKQPKDLCYGAAVLTSKGKIYSACNYFSYTSTLTLHAEQAALAHAAAHGEPDVKAISCISTEGSKEKLCHPCGICKQLIWENSYDSGIDVEVVMAARNGEFSVEKISRLCPKPWPVKQQA